MGSRLFVGESPSALNECEPIRTTLLQVFSVSKETPPHTFNRCGMSLGSCRDRSQQSSRLQIVNGGKSIGDTIPAKIITDTDRK